MAMKMNDNIIGKGPSNDEGDEPPPPYTE